MKPVIDTTKEYGLVLDGGGARGAYQIGAWKALVEAGVKFNAVAGTSVGALNGALICMGDVEKAENIWREMTFSTVMDVDDEWMEGLFRKETTIKEFLNEGWKMLGDGGVDVTPLRRLIHETVDEEAIRNCGKEFCLLTFSLSEFRELDLSIDDIPEGTLEDFLLASAYLIGFKNERIQGKKYIDGGVVNNVPLNSLVKRGYEDIIAVRIYGPGREPRVRMPQEGEKYEIAPRVKLGSIIEFSGKRSRQNMIIGYYDAKRMIYGLEGTIYYLEQLHDEEYYDRLLSDMREIEKAEIAFVLKLPLGFKNKELFMGMLEAAAKLLQIPKYQIYTVDQLYDMVYKKYEALNDKMNLPRFVHILTGLREGLTMNLKGRHFLTLKDYTPKEIEYLLDLAADLKEKKKNGVPVDKYRGMN
ncbi:MAG: patatin-like phospholipase family protein, partial [Lachnospiraceae bacterium]|nr:patatin-like phospholipase family protein [Lachnospiraceae bacterium]